MNETCPWCGCSAVDVSAHDNDCDQRAAFICTGPDTHRWRAGDGPAPEISQAEPLIVLARY